MADSHSPEEIRKHLKVYTIVGAALLFCTLLTVVVAMITPSITIGLLIACFKAGLVALIFMHLNAEKPLIYKVLFFTTIFFFGLMFLSLLALFDPVVNHNFKNY